MNTRPRKLSRLLIAVFMLGTITILTLPKTVCALGYCETCGQQCRNEAFSLYNQCRENGGSVSYCDGQMDQYNRNCQAIFCDSCPFLPL